MDSLVSRLNPDRTTAETVGSNDDQPETLADLNRSDGIPAPATFENTGNRGVHSYRDVRVGFSTALFIDIRIGKTAETTGLVGTAYRLHRCPILVNTRWVPTPEERTNSGEPTVHYSFLSNSTVSPLEGFSHRFKPPEEREQDSVSLP